jgi:ubiquinone/menaquinone biosynthesis C-methylase UbiE
MGCGFGYVLNSIKAKLRVGVDISLERLKQVPSKIIRVRANGENVPLENNYFDVVVCSDVGEHVKNFEKLINECWRVLKNDGLFLFACPWEQDLSVYDSKEYKLRFKSYKWRHLRSINEKVIKKYFDKKFYKLAEVEIRSVRRFQKLNPYSIMFMEFVKENRCK